MSSSLNALTSLSQTAANAAPATIASATDPLANEQTFLKLLVSQLQNQNPLSPTDSTQFVSQLTSYSQLEQLIGIRQNTAAPTAPAAAAKTNSTGGI